jgi:hypothetical protein
MTFLIKCQAEDLVKMDKCPSKWPWLNQIGPIECIGFNQIDHLDLTHSQMNHTHSSSFSAKKNSWKLITICWSLEPQITKVEG